MFTCIHHLGILSLRVVCHLRHPLYGLKQAPRAWFQRFASVVTSADFFASALNSALFVHVLPRDRTLLLFMWMT
jgi:hypothetical protein